MVTARVRSQRRERAGRVAVMLLSAVLVAACGGPSTSAPALTSAPPTAGRSVCPGSVPAVLTDLRGPAADTLEELQAAHEGDPGFMAAVYDGAQATVVVEARHLAGWQARLQPLGIAVAPSCVDPVLLAAVHAVLPALSARNGGVMSAGYNGLDDTIEVAGIEPDVLIAALDDLEPAGLGDAARAAVVAGTLRFSGPVPGDGVRQ